MNAASDEPGGTEDSDRIDALLSTALADQARERRTLVETVFGAKSALVKAQEEIAELRELITRRDDALMEAVGKSNEALLATISTKIQEAVKAQPKARIAPARDAGLTLRIEAIEDGILALAERIAELPGLVRGELEERTDQLRRDLEETAGQLRRDLEVSALAIGERIGEESASLLADLREDQVEVVQTLVSMSETTSGDVKAALNRSQQEILERISNTGRDTIEAGASTVEQMVEHLTGYLHERDEQLYRARDQRLIELFQQLSDTISRTTKRKLAKIIEEDHSPPKPVSPPMTPAKPPPPLSVPRNFRQPTGEQTAAMKSPFAPGSDPGRDQGPSGSFGRPDPAYSFDEPSGRPFDDPPRPPFSGPSDFGRSDDPFARSEPPPVRPEPPLGSSEPPFRSSNQNFNRPEASPMQAMANPLTRAELVRDYLIESPADAFNEDPPVRNVSTAGWKAPAMDDEAPARPKSRRGPGRPPKSPGSPRTRRKV